MLYAVGGQAAAALPAAVPLVGADRFATARVVAEAVFDDPTAVGLASGINFPDGLSGGAHAGRLGAPLLLVRPDILPAQAAGYLTASASGTTVHVYGGRAAVGYTVTHEVDQLLTGGWVALAVSACSSARRPPGRRPAVRARRWWIARPWKPRAATRVNPRPLKNAQMIADAGALAGQR